MDNEPQKSEQETASADPSSVAPDASPGSYEAERSAHEAATKAVVDSQKSAGLA